MLESGLGLKALINYNYVKCSIQKIQGGIFTHRTFGEMVVISNTCSEKIAKHVMSNVCKGIPYRKRLKKFHQVSDNL